MDTCAEIPQFRVFSEMEPKAREKRLGAGGTEGGSENKGGGILEFRDSWPWAG